MRRDSKKITISKKVMTKEVFHFPNEKWKIVFEVPNSAGELKRCIYWGLGTIPKFDVGDEVNMEGQIKNGVFLVWSLKYKVRNNADSHVQK